MNILYQIYQAERPLSTAEQREGDVLAGEIAAAFARLGRILRHQVTGGRDARWTGQPPAIESLSCAATRPR
jgi:hypothetical protein